MGFANHCQLRAVLHSRVAILTLKGHQSLAEAELLAQVYESIVLLRHWTSIGCDYGADGEKVTNKKNCIPRKYKVKWLTKMGDGFSISFLAYELNVVKCNMHFYTNDTTINRG